MLRLKTIYVCSECRATASKWSGQCESCGAWNSLVEDVVEKKQKQKISTASSLSVKPLQFDLHEVSDNRFSTNITELDRVLGGGFVEGGYTLFTGDPGIGKSTLSLQIAKSFVDLGESVLYVSGEESVAQISNRAKRLQFKNTEKFFLINEMEIEKVCSTIVDQKPKLAIVDSVQVMYSPELGAMPGSVSQVKFVAESLMRIAKEHGVSILLIGHVTKDGNLAGPMFLSHLVDTVLFLEGEKLSDLRILRSQKNRFGSTSEVGVFEMKEEGLCEMSNPSASFLSGRMQNAMGSCVTAIVEGSRPFLVEIQALTTYTKFGNPKRAVSGYDMNRLHLLIAVLDKYCNLNLDSQDVFVNIVGGMKVNDRSTDLAVCMAIMSSKKKIPLSDELFVVGEVGLSGEVRAVTQLEKRLREAENMNCKKLLAPPSKVSLKKAKYVEVKKIQEIQNFFQKSH